MKGNTRLYVVLLVVVLSLVITGVALAQAITSYTGSIQLANLEAQQASVVVEFVPQSGVSSTFNYTIAGNGGLKLFPLSVTGPFNGSVIVSSDKKVTAVANVMGNTGGTDNLYYQGAYEGFDAGNSRVNIPLVQANNAGNFSWFNIQNTGSGAAVVNINFLPRDANMGSHRIADVSIDQGRAKTFKLSDYTAQLYGSAGKFVGSVVITTSVGQVAAVAIQENTTTQASIGAYDGFLGNAGSTEIVAPLLQYANSNNSLYSAMNIQNVGAATTTVTATYSAPVCPGCTYNPVQEVKTIGPGKIGTFNLLEGTGQWTGGIAAGKRWVGGASVKSDGQPLVGVALQLRMDATKWTSVYDMFDPAAGTNKALAALLQFDNGQTFSSATVYNLGPDALQLQLTYSANTCGAACTFQPVPETLTAPVGGVANFRMLEGATAQWTSTSAAQKRYVGSGTITKLSGTGPFVVVVNEQRLSSFGRPMPAGDSLKSYGAVNVAP